MSGSQGEPPVGSLGDEAAKLVHALQGWVRESSQEHTDAADGAADWLQKVDEHIATGGRDCTYCPVCHLISAARRTSPEVKQHLTVAAGSLLQAAAGFLATRAPASHEQRSQPVEHIDLDDPSHWEDD